MAGLGDQVAGKAKEAQGHVTGDEDREAEGKAQNTKGQLQEKVQSVKDSAAGTVEEVKGKLHGAKADAER
jgi:uncharacterized protein YjbJ (UPF0337 family)